MLILAIILNCSTNLFSQCYYYYKDNRVNIERNNKLVLISTLDTVVYKSSYSYFQEFYEQNSNVSLKKSDYIRFEKTVEFNDSLSENQYIQRCLSLKNTKTIICPYFSINGKVIGSSIYFYVCLYNQADTIVLKDIADEYKIRIVCQDLFMPNWFTLAITNESAINAIEAANIFYETGFFKYSEPDWRINKCLLNDELYQSQWNLSNKGQNCGTPAVDINVESAWQLSRGDNIVVAVIDNGVQLDHPDLIENIYPVSFDADTYSSGSRIYGNHGTRCAGIIGAVQDNSIGISGIAPNCKIMSISLSLKGHNSTSQYVAAINWAWKNGADILSNSYYIPTHSAYIEEALDSAANYGRGGLGCPIFFASGNDNSSTVVYPASLPNTIAVGAISPCGERKNPGSCDGESYWGSNYGENLDFVAPGVLIPTTNIDGGYVNNFNGTSSACPHAAATMALILSANPCLSAADARRILSESCDKLSNFNFDEQKEFGSWNNQIGYGKINATAAVLQALGIHSQNYITSGNVTSVSNNYRLVIQNGCAIPAGIYIAKRHEVSKEITFPYCENPIISASANGYSAANPNSGLSKCLVSNVTNTSAKLKTYVYEVQYNINGQQIGAFVPVAPENITFKVSVFDKLDTNVVINNLSITDMQCFRQAFSTMETGDFAVGGSSEVVLRAGEEIIFGDGTNITLESGGNFYAYVEPYVSCTSDNRHQSFLAVRSVQPYGGKEKLSNFEETSNTTQSSSPTVYPNPTYNILNVDLKGEEISHIVIHDIQGRVVYNKSFAGKQTAVLSTNNLPAGIYLLLVTDTAGMTHRAKMVKK